VLWFGTREAKRIAMREVARYRSPHAVLPIVDSALEDPALLPDAVAALGEIGSARARFFLAQVFHEGQPALREQAASALARIGGSALEPLREALRAPSREERLVAVRALLAVAGEDDLSALYEYLANHPDDDPPTTAAVRTAAERIEQELEARRAAEAASGSPESF
jgi:HEAT repeat protein